MASNSMNVVMFVPIGLLLPCCFRKFEKNKRIFLTALICSSGIELLQGIFKIGMLETDDVLGNVLGAEIGFLNSVGEEKREKTKVVEETLKTEPGSVLDVKYMGNRKGVS